VNYSIIDQTEIKGFTLDVLMLIIKLRRISIALMTGGISCFQWCHERCRSTHGKKRGGLNDIIFPCVPTVKVRAAVWRDGLHQPCGQTHRNCVGQELGTIW